MECNLWVRAVTRFLSRLRWVQISKVWGRGEPQSRSNLRFTQTTGKLKPYSFYYSKISYQRSGGISCYLRFSNWAFHQRSTKLSGPLGALKRCRLRCRVCSYYWRWTTERTLIQPNIWADSSSLTARCLVHCKYRVITGAITDITVVLNDYNELLVFYSRTMWN